MFLFVLVFCRCASIVHPQIYMKLVFFDMSFLHLMWYPVTVLAKQILAFVCAVSLNDIG